MTLLGQIEPALGFGFTQLGKPYDHTAADGTRFGPDRYDCSGFVSRCLWAGGMPRYNDGFGENSASMASWAERNPLRNIGAAAAKRVRGALLIAGGTTGWGDAGHVAFSLGDGTTLESNGAHGVCVDNAYRMTWSHGVLPPINYAPAPPPAAPAPPVPFPLEDTMGIPHVYDPQLQQHHTMTVGRNDPAKGVNRDGHIIHSWMGTNGIPYAEDLSMKLNLHEWVDPVQGFGGYLDAAGTVTFVGVCGDGAPLFLTSPKGSGGWGARVVGR